MEIFWFKEFWLPNSPDLNPTTTCGASLNDNRSRHLNVTSLQTAIEAVFANMNKDTLQRAC